VIHGKRRSGPLVSFYAAFAALSLAFAHWAAPPIIEAAYHGRSLEALNRFFRGRQPHPVEHYFHLWNDFAAAVLIAGALHLAFVLLIRRLDRGMEPNQEAGRASRWLTAFAAAFLTATVLAWTRHDYVADLEIWTVVLRGGDPWWIIPEKGVPLHAYGPLFNALAIPAAFNPMLPKLLFAFAYLATVAWLVKGIGPRRGLVGLPWASRIAWLINPFVWVEIAYFGHWDILVAVACVAAVHERSRGRDIVAGSWLAAGILLKYLPVVILPFLVVEGRRVRWRLLLAAMLATAAGLALSRLVWGPSTFRAIAYGAARPSTLLSVFRFLRGAYSPLGVAFDTPSVDALALPCLTLAGLAVFAWCWIRRVGPAAGALLGVLATLLFYRVGFPQYQVVPLMLASYWVVAERRPGRDAILERFSLGCGFISGGAGVPARPTGAGPGGQGHPPHPDGSRYEERGTALALTLGLYFGWLALFDVFYALVGGVLHPGDRFARLEDVVGLPTFLLGCLLIAAVARASARARSL
jgi:hypothetical protein